ncbi:MAG TPA: hypothetical protein DD456_08545 [Stenotrophomonas sp.]|nr:hypothetical protein [Stenotrophomonas sp.]
MRGFLRRQRWLLLLLALLAIWLSLFSAWAHRITAEPLDEPIALAPAGVIDRKIQVVVPEHYTLVFRFQRMDRTSGQQALLGGVASTGAGIPIPIRWSLATVSDGRTVASGEGETDGMSAWSASHVERDVGGIRVPNGHYRFKAQVLHDVPGLAHFDTRLVMRLQPKSSSTWQLDLVWWGSIANMLLLGPLAIIVLLVLLWHAARACRPVQKGV